MSDTQLTTSTGTSSIRDVLELVLDKGIVIVGDIQVKIADIDLLTIKIRLLVCGVDKALEMGINWWQDDPYLSARAREDERDQLLARIEKLEGANRK
nr:gas vesicle protein [uncultured Draconibacterium sp.]